VYAGAQVPEPVVLNVNKDQNHCLSKGPLLSEEWVINKKNKGVRWTFVWLAPSAAGEKLPIHPDLQEIKVKQVDMDQPCCMFTPHCVGLRQGQSLVSKNSSPIAHNTHWQGHPLRNAGGNVIIPAGGSHEIKDLVADRLPVKV